jgi:hypothetical protein
MTSEKPHVVIHLTDDGEIEVLAAPGIRVVWVDEQAPRDRVYAAEPRNDTARMAALIDGTRSDITTTRP